MATDTDSTLHKRPDRLIVNSPFVEPRQYWQRHERMFRLVDGRRPAGFVRASERSKTFDDPGIFVPLPLVNQIRPRVAAWRQAGYPGVTGISKRLLEHWNNPDEHSDRRLFFCQIEAMETLIWLAEAPAADRQGIEIPSDGGLFRRLCSKMATGSGKTVVMAMLIAWQAINKTTYPHDKRFSKYVFIVAPGLTVRKRLEVLQPSGRGNYYDEFNIVPAALRDNLRQVRILIRNWHTLMPLDPNSGPKVEKKGPESDEAFTRRVLDQLATGSGLVVINDEAHHAWRVAPKSTIKGLTKDEIEEATQWVGGLDRIHKTRGINTCYDFSATPFAPTGKLSGEETLFGWIVSDFGLDDAIESGLVKTPRVVIRDDGRYGADYKTRLYHIYPDDEVKDDINRRAKPEEPLPDLIINAYYLLGKDWLECERKWREKGHPTPPVMITVANRTETAARIKYAFDHGEIKIDELQSPEKTLHIDSRVLDKAEEQEEALSLASESDSENEDGDDEEEDRPVKKLTKQQQAEFLRQVVDTVGKVGQPGEQIQKVISVGMLSEGWDAKTVTHIMGLRAFTSQLLCEQVVGRGLRRTSYEINPKTERFDPEYVNIFGVPFTFMPHEGGGDVLPPPPPPKDEIFADPTKRQFEINWPNVVRIDHTLDPTLHLDWNAVEPLNLDANDVVTRVQLSAILEGKPNLIEVAEIDLEELSRRFRLQKIVFETARQVFDQVKPTWKGNREYLLAQVIGLVEQFVTSDRIVCSPPLVAQTEVRRRVLLTVSMTKIVQHMWSAIRFQNTEKLEPILDREHPIRSTGDMLSWRTGRPNHPVARSHINRCVFDSTWEATEAFILDRDPHVAAWVKNDHIGFEILYVYLGVVSKFWPDFLIRLTNGTTLVLEVKGQDSQKDQTKRKFLDEWVTAINAHGGFGRWAWDVSQATADVERKLAKHGEG